LGSRSQISFEQGYKKMTDALVNWRGLKAAVPPMSKFFDFSFVDTAWK
jgi:hypothetical protein